MHSEEQSQTTGGAEFQTGGKRGVDCWLRLGSSLE